MRYQGARWSFAVDRMTGDTFPPHRRGRVEKYTDLFETLKRPTPSRRDNVAILIGFRRKHLPAFFAIILSRFCNVFSLCLPRQNRMSQRRRRLTPPSPHVRPRSFGPFSYRLIAISRFSHAYTDTGLSGPRGRHASITCPRWCSERAAVSHRCVKPPRRRRRRSVRIHCSRTSLAAREKSLVSVTSVLAHDGFLDVDQTRVSVPRNRKMNRHASLSFSLRLSFLYLSIHLSSSSLTVSLALEPAQNCLVAIPLLCCSAECFRQTRSPNCARCSIFRMLPVR